MAKENRIDYVEIPVTDPAKARDFFAALMGWEFQEWGDDYISFNDGRLDGGFRRSAQPAPAEGVLVVFFSTDLERDRDRVVDEEDVVVVVVPREFAGLVRKTCLEVVDALDDGILRQ